MNGVNGVGTAVVGELSPSEYAEALRKSEVNGDG